MSTQCFKIEAITQLQRVRTPKESAKIVGELIDNSATTYTAAILLLASVSTYDLWGERVGDNNGKLLEIRRAIYTKNFTPKTIQCFDQVTTILLNMATIPNDIKHDLFWKCKDKLAQFIMERSFKPEFNEQDFLLELFHNNELNDLKEVYNTLVSTLYKSNDWYDLGIKEEQMCDICKIIRGAEARQLMDIYSRSDYSNGVTFVKLGDRYIRFNNKNARPDGYTVNGREELNRLEECNIADKLKYREVRAEDWFKSHYSSGFYIIASNDIIFTLYSLDFKHVFASTVDYLRLDLKQLNELSTYVPVYKCKEDAIEAIMGKSATLQEYVCTGRKIVDGKSVSFVLKDFASGRLLELDRDELIHGIITGRLKVSNITVARNNRVIIKKV